jgi:hypothetical protein
MRRDTIFGRATHMYNIHGKEKKIKGNKYIKRGRLLIKQPLC